MPSKFNCYLSLLITRFSFHSANKNFAFCYQQPNYTSPTQATTFANSFMCGPLDFTTNITLRSVINSAYEPNRAVQASNNGNFILLIDSYNHY